MLRFIRRWFGQNPGTCGRRASRIPSRTTGFSAALEQRTLLAAFTEFVDPNPSPGNRFGHTVVPLSTGNVVVTSPGDDAGGTNAGAVYLFNGATGALISTLTGSHADDSVGFGNIVPLDNGNFVVVAPQWDNGAIVNAGAVTWVNGSTGLSGVISAANSLVGTSPNDSIGSGRTVALANGNYAVASYLWDNGSVVDAGAVTWGNGLTGVSGAVSSSNSLVGSSSQDLVGISGLTPLANGNYVINSAAWDNGVTQDVGAVTWGDGAVGITGVVSPSNSLIGGTAFDQVGNRGALPLSNGHYLVSSTQWWNGTTQFAGAVTWGNGMGGTTGVVTAANSLVGSSDRDFVGDDVRALKNGNYVVLTRGWDNGSVPDAGAVTFGSGTAGVSGSISSANSLVGTHDFDQVGYDGIVELTNGHFVIRSSTWGNGTAQSVGAVTWASGFSGIAGEVSSANSLIGSTEFDAVGRSQVIPLSNGNYIVASPWWDNGAATDAGAVTWGNGTTGISGVVSAANSLVGNHTDDFVGDFGNVALTNGNYVVRSSNWFSGRGAVTWGNGTRGITGTISESNSLIGGSPGDAVGQTLILPLSNGNYVVSSMSWGDTRGAVTWGNGRTGTRGIVSAGNSLVGAQASDYIGVQLTELTNGNYVVVSYFWGNGTNQNAGAVTWGNGRTGTRGVVSSANSLVGTRAFDYVGIGGITALANGNYVIGSPDWNESRGAATWAKGTKPIAGVISAQNSLIGSTPFDRVGGEVLLVGRNYVVTSRAWSHGVNAFAGAATWGSGRRGIVGLVSSANSLIGLSASTDLQPPILDSVNETFISAFPQEGAGRVRVRSQS